MDRTGRYPPPRPSPSSHRSSLSEAPQDVLNLKAKVLALSISVSLSRCIKQCYRMGLSSLFSCYTPSFHPFPSPPKSLNISILSQTVENNTSVILREMVRGVDKKKVRLEVRREHAILAILKLRRKWKLRTAWEILKRNQGLETSLMLKIAFKSWKSHPKRPHFPAQTVSNRLNSLFSHTSRRHTLIKQVYLHQWKEIVSMTASRRNRKQDFYSKIWFVLSTVGRRMRFIAWNRLKKTQNRTENRSKKEIFLAKIGNIRRISCSNLVHSLDFMRKSTLKSSFFVFRFIYFREKRAKVTSKLLKRALLPQLHKIWRIIHNFSQEMQLKSVACDCFFHAFNNYRKRLIFNHWNSSECRCRYEEVLFGVRKLVRMKGKVGARLKAEGLARICEGDPWMVSKRTAVLKMETLVRYREIMKAKMRLR